MLFPFDQMPNTARLWIYQSERKLTTSESKLIEESTSKFLEAWTAHGNELKAAHKLSHDQFLIIALDEGMGGASGCSIDASVNHIRQLENQIGTPFINNGKVAFLLNDEIELLPLAELKGKVTAKKINRETKVFDNTVQNLGDFRSRWIVNSEETWISRYFN